jgi:colanic acid/amylovoran biosynthesis protein
MRILVDQSGYELTNIGDVAMLQSCVIRLKRLWPEAEIMIIVREPERLATYCRGTIAVERTRDQLFRNLIPRRYRPEWESVIPYLSGRFDRGRPSQLEPHTAVQAVRAADVVVAAGGGYLNDTFWVHATGVLGLLSLAQRLGKPTAMFGQGVGPISQRRLRMQARAVLPKLAVLSLREDSLGRDLALSLGALPRAVSVTGDEALELIDETRAPEGHALGVSMRVTSYAGVDSAAATAIGDLLLESAGMLRAPIVALPVSRGAAGQDLAAIRALFRPGYSHAEIVLNDLMTPESLIDAVASCRAVVTGSYHAAVFGLAQGIPTIGLTKTPYYDAKFAGLRALFPSACFVVPLSQPDFAVRLRAAIHQAWHLPVPARVAARDAAAWQRSAGREAYAHFRRSVGDDLVKLDAESQGLVP